MVMVLSCLEERKKGKRGWCKIYLSVWICLSKLNEKNLRESYRIHEKTQATRRRNQLNLADSGEFNHVRCTSIIIKLIVLLLSYLAFISICFDVFLVFPWARLNWEFTPPLAWRRRFYRNPSVPHHLLRILWCCSVSDDIWNEISSYIQRSIFSMNIRFYDIYSLKISKICWIFMLEILHKAALAIPHQRSLLSGALTLPRRQPWRSLERKCWNYTWFGCNSIIQTTIIWDLLMIRWLLKLASRLPHSLSYILSQNLSVSHFLRTHIYLPSHLTSKMIRSVHPMCPSFNMSTH